jgi:tripartite-type tricarboxylate transporter receptor subunit TctC
MNAMTRLVLAVGACAMSLSCMAQAWPDRPVHLVVGFPPGGPADSVARALAQAIAPALGQPVLVDNRPGALGTIGADSVARATPDGNTVLMAFSGGHALTPAVMKVRYDPLRELPSLIGVARSELVFVTGPQNKGKTLKDLAEETKAKSGQMNIGAIGTGSTNHVVSELWRQRARINAQHVPYSGAAPLALAVMSGQVDLAVIDLGGVLSYIQSGKLVALAVASSKRSAYLPEVPTTAESGFPSAQAENVYCLFTPVGVPAAVRKRLSDAIATAVGQPEVREQFTRLGLVPQVISASELDAVIDQQLKAMVPLVQRMNLRP